MDELTGSAPIPLRDATLGRLRADVRVPRYDRAGLTPGIVHIGLGNFHRAHQAWYLHRLMDEGRAHDWAIVGAGVRPADAEQRARLMAQDGLTTLISLAPDGMSAEVCGAMVDFAAVEEGNAALIARMTDPAIRIVSLTVTEGGYYQAPGGGLDEAHPDIVHDAAHPGRPRTAFGAIVAALRARRAAGTSPFTCMSCDNLQGNGAILRRATVSLARMTDPRLADWIDAEGTFPNAMVDCIVPATGPRERALAAGFGIDDDAPVTHEDFRQWVMEDAFCAGRPDWDAVGATFTADVHAHETLKLRVLNAGHQILANAGELMGCETIADCMAHPALGAFLRTVETREILPHVAGVPGTTPEAYLALVARRFANPMIRDTTRRVAFDGSARHPGFVLPSLRARLTSGAPVEGLALTQALWSRMCAGTRDDGTAIEPNDPHWVRLMPVAQAARERPAAWLEQQWLYGDLREAEALRVPFERWLDALWAEGTGPALRHYLAL